MLLLARLWGQDADDVTPVRVDALSRMEGLGATCRDVIQLIRVAERDKRYGFFGKVPFWWRGIHSNTAIR